MKLPTGADLNPRGLRYMDLFPARSEPLRRAYTPRSQRPAKSPLLRSRFIFPDSFKVLELDPKLSDDTWLHIHCNYNPEFVQEDDREEDLLLGTMRRYGWIAIEPSVGSATPEFLGLRVYILPPPRPAEQSSCIVCAVLPWPVHDATERELLEFENGIGFLTVFGLREYCRAKEAEEAVLGPRRVEQLRECFLAKLKSAVPSKPLLDPKPYPIAEKQCESPSETLSLAGSGPSSAHSDDEEDNRPCEAVSERGSETSEVRSPHSCENSPVKYSTESSSSCSSKYSEELSHIGRNPKGGLPDIAVRVLLEALGRTVASK